MLVFFVALFFPSVLALASPAYRRKSATPVSIPISRRINSRGRNVAEADRTRAHSLAESAKTKSKLFPISDKVQGYTISVGVGSPPTTYEVIFDTGSSNTWVGANKTYITTSTSVNTSQTVGVSYGTGFFLGTEFFDILSLGNLHFNQSIGVSAVDSGTFSGFDGIMGMGPTGLTEGTLLEEPSNETIPTVIDSLHAQGLIQEKLFSVFLKPTVGDDTPTETGEIDLGGIDYAKAAGPITFVPITNTSPSNEFWGVDMSITLPGRQKPILAKTAGVVDTGTTLLNIATDAFEAYQEATGALPDNSTGLLKITKKQFQKLPSLYFHLNDVTLELTRDAQAWPQHLNEFIDGEPGAIYLIVSDLGTPSGQGFDFILGETALRRFYSIYDSDHNQVGFSTTAYTYSVSNVLDFGFP